MNITLEKTGDLTSEIKIHLLSDDYKTKVEEELKRQARKAVVPGFRPGKVPLGMVRKMVGKAVVIDEVTKAFSKSLSDYIEEQKLNILGEPLVKDELQEEDIDLNCEKEVELTFEVGFAPDFELNTNLENRVKKYDIQVDDVMINSEIESLQDRYADVSNPEVVAPKDVIYGKLFETDENGDALSEGFEKMVALNPERVENQEIFPPFIDKKIGDILPLDIFSLATEEAKVREILFVDADQLEALKDKPLRFEVKRINRLTKAALDEAFFQKVAKANNWEDAESYTDEASFRAKLTAQIKEEMEESSTWYLQNQMRKALTEVNTLSFPEEFLKKWLLKSNKESKEEDIEKDLPEMLKSLNWTLIVNKVNELYPETKTEMEEVKEDIKVYMKERYAHMEELNDEKRLDDLVNYTLQNEELLRMHVKRISDKKLFDKLNEIITLESETISATDFSELMKQE
ncbi:MAG: trigger factor family protein [Bacteroidia bacterium]|nr:trigger factor family protein [Bacteroidia bacterium]